MVPETWTGYKILYNTVEHALQKHVKDGIVNIGSY